MAVLAGGQTWGLSTKREEDKKHVVLVKLTDAALKAINQHNKTKVRAKGRVWALDTGAREGGRPPSVVLLCARSSRWRQLLRSEEDKGRQGKGSLDL